MRKQPIAKSRASEPIRAIIYTRLSNAKSGDSRADAGRNTEASLETQRASCERAVAALGGVVVGAEHDVLSGGRMDREGVWNAIERVKTGEANTLIVHALDRLGRNNAQQGHMYWEVQKAGGRILSATENLEDGPLGEVMRSLYTFAAEMELEKTKERIRRSQEAKFRQQKRYKPAQRPPYGYRKIGKGKESKYEVDPAESLIVQRIYAERAAGSSVRQIVLGLRRDGIPTPTGRGNWSTHPVQIVLEREVYWSGQHEVWRTKTEHDTEGKPYLVDRPAEDRYTVPFPIMVDRTVAAAAASAAERNRWKSHRHDRTGGVGIGRYGFFTCGTCGRALTVINPKVGNPRYACTQHRHLTNPCPAPVSISVDKIDLPVWWWIQAVMENPGNAQAWVPTFTEYAPDETLSAAIMEAGRELTALETQRDHVAENLTLVSGAAAATLLRKLEAVEAEIAALKTGRIAPLLAQVDREQSVHRGGHTLNATDAVTRATARALHAMQAADPEPEQSHRITVRYGDSQSHSETVPDSWAAKRAAMSELGLRVQIFPESAEQPRWVAEITVEQSVSIRGNATPDGWFTRPDTIPDDYLFRSNRYSG